MSDRARLPGPLTGLRVVELAGKGPGPFAALMLADLGAEVLRVERPEQAAGATADPLAGDRACLGLDLKDARGREVLLALLGRADVLVEGFRPGVLERLGCAPDVLLDRNRALLVARMTGWGQSGPLADQPGHDLNYLALSGALHAMGGPAGPPPVPLNLVADFGGGGMLLVVGVLAALAERARTGRGRVIDVAMVDGVGMLSTLFQTWLDQGRWTERRSANLLDGGAPFYDTYPTGDGGFVAVAAMEPAFFAALLELTGIDPEEYGDQHDRDAWDRQRRLLAERFAGRDRAHWAAHGAAACVTPVLTFTEARSHPHAIAREAYRTGADGHTRAAPAPRFDGVPPRPAGPADLHGILADAGIGPDTLRRLEESRVCRLPR